MSAAGDFIIMAERGMDGKFTKVPVEPIVQSMEVKEENKEEELQISKRLAVLENLMLKSQVDTDQKLVAMMQKTDARFMQVMELMQGKSDSETDRSDATHFDYQTPRNEGRPLKVEVCPRKATYNTYKRMTVEVSSSVNVLTGFLLDVYFITQNY